MGKTLAILGKTAKCVNTKCVRGWKNRKVRGEGGEIVNNKIPYGRHILKVIFSNGYRYNNLLLVL